MKSRIFIGLAALFMLTSFSGFSATIQTQKPGVNKSVTNKDDKHKKHHHKKATTTAPAPKK